MLHDAGGALAAQRALVHRVIAIALDMANLPIAQMDFDATPARAHVTGGEFDDVGNRRRQIDIRFLAHLVRTPDDRLWRSWSAAIGGRPANDRDRRLRLDVIPSPSTTDRNQVE